jgi:hypothetical protein
VIINLLFAFIIAQGFLKLGASFGYLLMPGLYIFAVLLALIDIIGSIVRKRYSEIPKVFLVMAVFPYVFTILVFAIPIVFVLYYLLQAVVAVTQRTLTILAQDTQIRRALIVWGILLFFVSGILQLIVNFP